MLGMKAINKVAKSVQKTVGGGAKALPAGGVGGAVGTAVKRNFGGASKPLAATAVGKAVKTPPGKVVSRVLDKPKGFGKI